MCLRSKRTVCQPHLLQRDRCKPTTAHGRRSFCAQELLIERAKKKQPRLKKVAKVAQPHKEWLNMFFSNQDRTETVDHHSFKKHMHVKKLVQHTLLISRFASPELQNDREAVDVGERSGRLRKTMDGVIG